MMPWGTQTPGDLTGWRGAAEEPGFLGSHGWSLRRAGAGGALLTRGAGGACLHPTGQRGPT